MARAGLDFSGAVREILEEYSDEVVDVVTEAADETRKEAVRRLRAASRENFGSGDYSKGWTSELKKGAFGASATVYGRSPTSSLAHLLEFGHVTRNGTGRTYAPTPAHPHIEAVNDWAAEDFTDRVERKLEGRS